MKTRTFESKSTEKRAASAEKTPENLKDESRSEEKKGISDTSQPRKNTPKINIV